MVNPEKKMFIRLLENSPNILCLTTEKHKVFYYCYHHFSGIPQNVSEFVKIDTGDVKGLSSITF